MTAITPLRNGPSLTLPMIWQRTVTANTKTLTHGDSTSLTPPVTRPGFGVRRTRSMASCATVWGVWNKRTNGFVRHWQSTQTPSMSARIRETMSRGIQFGSGQARGQRQRDFLTLRGIQEGKKHEASQNEEYDASAG